MNMQQHTSTGLHGTIAVDVSNGETQKMLTLACDALRRFGWMIGEAEKLGAIEPEPKLGDIPVSDVPETFDPDAAEQFIIETGTMIMLDNLASSRYFRKG